MPNFNIILKNNLEQSTRQLYATVRHRGSITGWTEKTVSPIYFIYSVRNIAAPNLLMVNNNNLDIQPYKDIELSTIYEYCYIPILKSESKLTIKTDAFKSTDSVTTPKHAEIFFYKNFTQNDNVILRKEVPFTTEGTSSVMNAVIEGDELEELKKYKVIYFHVRYVGQNDDVSQFSKFTAIVMCRSLRLLSPKILHKKGEKIAIGQRNYLKSTLPMVMDENGTTFIARLVKTEFKFYAADYASSKQSLIITMSPDQNQISSGALSNYTVPYTSLLQYVIGGPVQLEMYGPFILELQKMAQPVTVKICHKSAYFGDTETAPVPLYF